MDPLPLLAVHVQQIEGMQALLRALVATHPNRPMLIQAMETELGLAQARYAGMTQQDREKAIEPIRLWISAMKS